MKFLIYFILNVDGIFFIGFSIYRAFWIMIFDWQIVQFFIFVSIQLTWKLQVQLEHVIVGWLFSNLLLIRIWNKNRIHNLKHFSTHIKLAFKGFHFVLPELNWDISLSKHIQSPCMWRVTLSTNKEHSCRAPDSWN